MQHTKARWNNYATNITATTTNRKPTSLAKLKGLQAQAMSQAYSSLVTSPKNQSKQHSNSFSYGLPKKDT